MALKAVHVSDVPNLDATLALCPTLFSNEIEGDVGDHGTTSFELPNKFVVMGHRGSGMNMLQSPDRRMKAIKENSILAFDAAGKFALDFIEFDVQVTKDDCPVIFHDSFILTKEKGAITEKRVTELTLVEFLSHGPQKEPKIVEKPLYRKTKDGRIFEWNVETDAPLCTLQEVFQEVDHSLGINIELKFDDNIVYKEEELVNVLQSILKVVFEYAKDRHIIFSSFQPDAAQLMRKLQTTYPVFFLTNGGSEICVDVRRNSLDEAINLCLEGGLQGIVSEVRAILRNPGSITKIKESKLSLLTYGQLNNVPEVVYAQHLIGVDGVIVDLVQEITEAVLDFIKLAKEGEGSLFRDKGEMRGKTKLQFSQHEPSFLLKHIHELIKS
ncbi:glycerophosphodiester phosphodiesterase GDPD1, chloroplastic-like [Cornus florida]|uniref:glycerophosphodiester phosphodiesterase GDPD1, chloroplastic-like n=1 Tax=Cornus florida TaxID=4283 RepID=UPI00289B473C|nr:glycerophosphodiester phosphodiesterase GDPD1, chloroplastic-like [Cornus florida]